MSRGILEFLISLLLNKSSAALISVSYKPVASSGVLKLVKEEVIIPFDINFEVNLLET